MTLLIMAAGMGSRYGGLKQIDPIGPNGEFIVDYSISDAIKAGFTKVVFIIKKENLDLFRETVGKRIESKIKVEYVFQEIDKIPTNDYPKDRIKPWGTGHAILSAKDVIDENFVVINSDDFYGYESFKILKDYMDNIDKNSYNFSMAGYITKNTLTLNGSVKRGICNSENDFLKTITESSIEYIDNHLIAKKLSDGSTFETDPNGIVSMNFFGFTPKLFEYLENDIKNFFNKNKNNLNTIEYLIPDVLQDMINNKICNIKIIKTNAIWHGVTYKEDREEIVKAIEDMIKKGVYPNNLWEKEI